MSKEPNPLLPLIKRCQRERGLKSRVLRMMVQYGIPGNWANLSEWLHPDPKKRRVPKESTMMGLMEIMREVWNEK